MNNRNNVMLSRVADSLYWMSRYLERAEHNARLLIVNLNMTLDDSPELAQIRWTRLLNALHIEIPKNTELDDYSITQLVTFDRSNPNSILSCIISARENARNVREQISSEMWEHLNELYLSFKSNAIDSIWNEGPFKFLRSIRNGSHLFEGITDSTMNHGEGWQFIQAGRFIERSNSMAVMLNVHRSLFDEPVNGAQGRDIYPDLLGILKSGTAFEAYCKIYTANLRRDHVAELLLLNPEFPHSVRFSIDRLDEALKAIAEVTEKRKANRANRLIGRIKAELSFDLIEEIISDGTEKYLKRIQRQCGEIHLAINEAYIAYPIQSVIV